MHESDMSDLLSRPADFFNSPQELVDSEKLEASAKIVALKQWCSEIRQLQVASDESMTANSSTSLQDVHDAIRHLGHDPGEVDPSLDDQ